MGLLTRHNGEVGFDSKVVDLIINCISSPQFLVLINGEARGLITPSKGLRQGNPLSPYLFLLVAKGFSFLLQKANTKGLILCRTLRARFVCR